ncbi:hypothetical protein PoMZ_01719 [Pyricularia oryzae]|uniref:Zn(2)-C6 fungal-type domain-containing protein n=1 Tax=Pyricularia oryzae TaxID=318829 RepID=A0A4P7N399_PYROR|nr:hypothetical protein PoMZ_01719 [Pyricularia oryzae]
MKFAGNPETRVGHQVTFNPQTFDANMQSHSETQSPSSQDLRQHRFSSKPKDALDDWTQAADLGERRRIENRVPPRNYRHKIKENRNDLGLHNLKYARNGACEQCRKRKIRCIVSPEDFKNCNNCIRSNKTCTFIAKTRPVSEHRGKPTFPNTQNIASWIGAKISLKTIKLNNLDVLNIYADAITWLPGDTMCGQPPVIIANAALPALFPTPFIATPYNFTTYPFILFDPHSQTIFPVFQEGLYLPECLPAYGTTSFGLDSNYKASCIINRYLKLLNTNTISAADPEVSVTQHIQQQDTAHNVQMVSRPKSQCWEHGCNGRSFSTFSNLLKHQRKKLGQATKATCLDCGTEFTRTTARNFHQKNGKCKPHPST